jgi:hypothetical protein
MAVPNKPAEWLARAAEANDFAEQAEDVSARKILFEIAAGYERLALYARSAKQVADIYRSSNGDRWRLITDSVSGRRFVRHEANPASGGQITETPVEDFLAVNGPGPEYEALRRLLGSSGAGQAGEVNRDGID